MCSSVPLVFGCPFCRFISGSHVFFLQRRPNIRASILAGRPVRGEVVMIFAFGAKGKSMYALLRPELVRCCSPSGEREREISGERKRERGAKLKTHTHTEGEREESAQGVCG